MVLSNEAMTVDEFIEALQGMADASNLPIKIRSFDFNSGIHSVRKIVETDEDNEQTDAFILING